MARQHAYGDPDYKPTAAQRAERTARQRDLRLRMAPAGRYWPTRVVVEAPTLEDGSLDVRAWLRQLDDHGNGTCSCDERTTPC